MGYDGDLSFAPATALARHIRPGSLSPVEQPETVLARPETVDPPLDAPSGASRTLRDVTRPLLDAAVA